jgi:hypothetical protein
MSSSYKGIDLFGSGPHRFRRDVEGQLMVPAFEFSPMPGWTSLGTVTPVVLVEGRLSAGSAAGLRTLIDAIRAQLLLWPEPGTLVSADGTSWVEMSFGRFEPTGPAAYGRTVSQGYVARFYRM